MAEIDVFKAQLVRPDPSTPWGFRLHRGGPDNQLLITRLTPGSPAANIGLKSGDAVTEIVNKRTKHMGEREAMDALNQHQTTLILTVERRASSGNAAPPAQPTPPQTVIQHVQAPQSVPTYYTNSAPMNHNNVSYDQPAYQPYDITGKSRNTGQGWGVATPKQYVPPNFEEAVSKPFDKPKNPYAHPPPPATQPLSPQPASPEPAQTAASPQSAQNDYGPGPVRYIPEEDKIHLGLAQSRTFKILTSLMENPPASTDNLPPRRSATLERVMAEDKARRNRNPERMKVFMSQQYNNPMGLYHPMNVVETFATQAVNVMDDMERKAQQEDVAMSSVQKAVLEEAPKR